MHDQRSLTLELLATSAAGESSTLGAFSCISVFLTDRSNSFISFLRRLFVISDLLYLYIDVRSLVFVVKELDVSQETLGVAAMARAEAALKTFGLCMQKRRGEKNKAFAKLVFFLGNAQKTN